MGLVISPSKQNGLRPNFYSLRAPLLLYHALGAPRDEWAAIWGVRREKILPPPKPGAPKT
jgi:hypothetical protein